MRRARYPALFCVVALSAVGLPAESAVASGSHPSSDIVEVSHDGRAYARDYSGLFDGRILVPRGKAADTFVVKNGGETPGFLRIVLATVEIPDRDVFHALTISAGTPGHPGRLVPVSVARPCLTLLKGRVLMPGQSVQVVSELALGDLSATAGQNVSVAFGLQILLSEMDDLADEGCAVAHSTPTRPGQHLAATGLAVEGVVGWAALVLIAVGGVGAAWFGRRRTKPARRPT